MQSAIALKVSYSMLLLLACEWQYNILFPHYFTESSEAGLFKISTSDGVISVLSEIDREVIGDTVTLTVKVHFYFIVNFLLSVCVTTVSLSISTN